MRCVVSGHLSFSVPRTVEGDRFLTGEMSVLCAVTTGRSVSSVPATPPIEADFRASHDGWGQGAVLG